MTGAGGLLPDDLEARLWHAPLPDAHRPERSLVAALDQGAEYGAVLAALRRLWRLALPGAEAAALAVQRWPRSIDFATLALDLSAPDMRAARLAALGACVAQANRRRAALANAALRHGDWARASQALAQIDPASETAQDDLFRRAELALALGQGAQARRDLARLRQHGDAPRLQMLELRLIHATEGARAMAQRFAGMDAPPASVAAQAFEIFLREGDFQRAPDALARWSAATVCAARARAEARLALEMGATARAQAALQARLDLQAPWLWDGADHVLWLRAQQAIDAEPAEIWAHAQAALRVMPRHDWLAHVAGFAQEAATDWRALVARPPAPETLPERCMMAARAALRLGLPARALARIAAARRAAGGRDAARLAALRAEIFWTAGRLEAASLALARAQARAVDRLQQAEIAVLGAEIALSRLEPETASAALAPLVAHYPDRMVLALTEARIAFQQGDFSAAQRSHARFNQLKAAQIGAFVPADVRDRITEDAAEAAARLDPAMWRGGRVADLVARGGLAALAASPGLSAFLMIRAAREGALAFTPAPTAPIPRQIAHYWQGPQGPAIARALEVWRKLHPDFTHHLFDAARAQDWLARAYPASVAERFATLDQPALRADLFRLCWIAREGGVFADLDEVPRLPVTPWLRGARAVFCLERGFGTVANNFLAAVPDHPVSCAARDLVIAALDQTDAPYAWWHSGPAQWTRAAFAAQFSGTALHLRYLSQAEYNRRVSTNLPYPHKRRADHWR
ncbi:MAG: hypothetical protein EA339_04620 [Rhodobacteraceae bacterium]|nr:MAG: hypothetical protein EA339_04620 [Paracoccaceae bacterium]